MSSLRPEIRVVEPDGLPGDVLPDAPKIDYLDDSLDVGTVSFDYPLRGIRASRIQPGAEFALFVGGEELPNGRFVLDEKQGNQATDDERILTWSGRTYLGQVGSGIVDEGAAGVARLAGQTLEGRKVLMDDWTARQKVETTYWRDGKQVAEPKDIVRKTQGTVRITETRTQPVWPEMKNPAWTRATPGKVVRALVGEARARGAFPGLWMSFTDTHDSDGKPWLVPWTGEFEVGTNLLDVLRELQDGQFCEVAVTGHTLNLYNSTFGNPDDTDASFAIGHNMLDGPVQASLAEIVTAAYVVSDKGPRGWVADPVLREQYGHHEAKFDVSLPDWQDCVLRGLAFIQKQARVATQYSFGIVPSAGTIPYRDFSLRSWVDVDMNGKMEQQRVRAITMSWDQDATPSIGITTNDRLIEQHTVRFKF